jgi:mannose-6-phosphate isomerase-like protein (cupin superfamily)
VSEYAVARPSEIAEVDDGRCPYPPVRHHFGITSFGVNAWTAREVGNRIINEHDESEPGSADELYLVMQGRAAFELDGEGRDVPAGTFGSCGPGSSARRSPRNRSTSSAPAPRAIRISMRSAATNRNSGKSCP